MFVVKQVLVEVNKISDYYKQIFWCATRIYTRKRIWLLNWKSGRFNYV